MAQIHKERKLNVKIDLFLIVFLGISLSGLYLSSSLFGDYSGIVTSVIYATATGYLCFISTRVLINSKKYEPKIFVPILMFTIAAFTIFAAEMTWIINVEVFDNETFPSFADIFYLSTYPFLGAYLIFRLKTYGLKVSKNTIIFVIGISTALFIPTLFAAYEWNFEEESTAFLTAMAYPLFDSALFGIAMIAFLYVFSKKQLTQFWSLIIAGIIIWVVADTAWLFMEIEEIYYDGHPIDVTWLVSYMLWGYAFTLRNKEITSSNYHPKNQQDYTHTINLSAITKIVIPLTLATIISVSTLFMFDYGIYSFSIDETIQSSDNLRYLIIGLMITFSTIIVLLLKNTKGLIKIRENELEIERQENVSSEKLSTIGELAARLAHDLRNPLSIIKNNMLIIKKTSKDPEFNGRIEVQRINDAIGRMSHQIENVLDFVKNREIEFSRVNVLALIKSAVGGDFKNIKFEFSHKETFVKCEPLLLEIVFINILNNAKHAIGNSGNIFTGINKVQDEITIRVKETPQKVIIEFEDAGPEIPSDVLSKIFEPLFTTKQQGTGLGLSSCKNIVEQHHGTIFVKNNPTTFTIILPKSSK